jgi:hypothetical protein
MTFDEAGRVWGVQLPHDIKVLSTLPPDVCIVTGGRELPLPWPPLSPDQIASAAAIAGDWEFGLGIVPVMGNFHDLICLRFVQGVLNEVVIIDDARTIQASFPTLTELVRATKTASAGDTPQMKGVIESSSWLDF